MYCEKCGKKIAEDAVFCKYCGERVKEIDEAVEVKEEIKEPEVITNKKEEQKNGLRTASIVLGIIALVGNIFIIFSFLSIVLAIIGLILAIVSTRKGRNIAGIVLNSISIILSILLISLMMKVINMIPSIISNELNRGNSIIEQYGDGDLDLDNIIDSFGRGNFDLNDIIDGFTHGDYDLDDFNIEGYNNKEETNERF